MASSGEAAGDLPADPLCGAVGVVEFGVFLFEFCKFSQSHVVLVVGHDGRRLRVVRPVGPVEQLPKLSDVRCVVHGRAHYPTNSRFAPGSRPTCAKACDSCIVNSMATSTTAKLLDGRSIAAGVREQIAQRVQAIRAQGGGVCLDAILAAGEDSAAAVYADHQGQACAKVGIDYHLHRLPADASYDDIAGRVLLLNTDDGVTGVMVHMPLPDGVDPYRIQRLIRPSKDVEGVNPANIGNIVYGRSSLAPCTAIAVRTMIESTGVELRGKTCVIVGASNIVGKPIAVLLMKHDATVVSANKYTADLPELTRRADVLVAAAGVPGLIKASMVKPGAIVVDVGTSRVADSAGVMRTVGDVAFEEVSKVAGWITPVPGGVGPVTVAMLLNNVVDAAERSPIRRGE